jgi:uncharacterized Tic20 family protein
MFPGVSEDEKKDGDEEKVSIPKPNLEVALPPDESPAVNRREEEASQPEEGAEDAVESADEVEEGEENADGEKGISSDEKLWATLVHLSAILGLLMMKLGSSQPIVCLLGPLALWLYKKDDMPFVDDQGKEAVNFQIVVAVIGIIFWITPWAGEYLLRLLLIADVAMSLYGATQANQGKKFRYPYLPDTLRMLK